MEMVMDANFEWTKKMTNRLRDFKLREEDKALFHYSRAERFTAVYLLSQSLVLFFVSSSSSALYWPWLSLSFTLAYFSSLPRPIASFHRIHDRLDLLSQFQHTRVQNRGFGFGSTNFLRIGLLDHQISNPSEIRFKMMARRLKTGGFVVLMAVFAAAMFLACRQPPPNGAVAGVGEGIICCALS